MSRSTAASPVFETTTASRPGRAVRAGAFLWTHAVDVALCIGIAVASFLILRPFLNPDFESIRGKVTYSWDEGVVLHHALRLRQGEMLYRDFFDFQGFFSYLPFTLGFTVATPGATTGKTVMFVLMSLWGAVTYLTVKEVTHKRWAGVLVALYFPLCVWPTWPFAYQHFIGDLWATTAVLFAIHGEKSNLRRGWLVAGVFSALAMWTSLSEGLPAFLALFASCLFVRYARRDRWHLLGQYLSGALAFTAFYVLVLVARGALVAAYEAVLVFPFKHYGPGNRTAYAYDAAMFVAQWMARGPEQGRAAQLLVDMTMNAPKIGVVVSSGVAALLAHRVLHRFYTGRPKHGIIPWDTFAPCVYVASLGSLAVPVWWGITRSDIAHIGFVQQMSVIAMTALWLPASTLRRRWWSGRWRPLAAIQILSGIAVVVVLLQAGTFFRTNVQNAKWKDIDEHIANDPAHPDRHCETLHARLEPDDRMVALSHGGYTHLTCKRRSAISIPHLLHNDPNYWGAMWPKAAREIAERRPRLLLVSPTDFEVLARYQPSLRSLYIGFNLNYMLAEGRPGPPLATGEEWWYAIHDEATGRLEREGALTFAKGPGTPMSSPYVALLDDAKDGVFTYLDGNKVQIFEGSRIYVLERGEDGRTMTGRAFEGVSKPRRMTVVKRGP